MLIDKKAISYRKKHNADFFVIRGQKQRNFSGCGCCSDGVTTLSPEPVLGFGDIPVEARLIEVEGEKIYVLPEVENCLTEDSKIKLDSLLMIKNLAMENCKPIVLRSE